MRRALLVDDNEDIRLLLHILLSAWDFEVVQAGGGAEALALLEAGVSPDLILLDVQMADVAGWDVLKHVRSNPSLGHVPVILCTVKASPDNAIRGWELGCDGYVMKPFDLDELREESMRVLSRDPSQREPYRQRRIDELRPVLEANEA